MVGKHQTRDRDAYIWLHNLGSLLLYPADCLREEDQLEQSTYWDVDREATGLKINTKTEFLESVVCKQGFQLRQGFSDEAILVCMRITWDSLLKC